MLDHISVKGARANNLKNIDVTIPRDKLVVLTGLRLRQVLPGLRHHLRRGPAPVRGVPSSYARMFLGQMESPT